MSLTKVELKTLGQTDQQLEIAKALVDQVLNTIGPDATMCELALYGDQCRNILTQLSQGGANLDSGLVLKAAAAIAGSAFLIQKHLEFRQGVRA